METTDSVLDFRDTTASLGYNAMCQEGVEQCLQAVLLNCGLLEGQSEGSTSPNQTLAGTASSFARTRPLREMRQTCRLRDLTQEAQTTLLGGTLCLYSPNADALPWSTARQSVLAATVGSQRDLRTATLAPDRFAPGEGMASLRHSFRRLVGLQAAEGRDNFGQSGTLTVLEDELASGADAAFVSSRSARDAIDEETLLASSLADNPSEGALIRFLQRYALRRPPTLGLSMNLETRP
jgi:hypothetical protein